MRRSTNQKSILVALILCLLALPCFVIAQGNEEVTLPAKDRFHLFLLAGQSNMAGRGEVEKEDKIAHPRVLMLGKDGKWKPAVDPMHYDKGSAGVGLGRTFAIELAERDKEIVIGLIPAACGGSPISTWQPGGYHGQTKSHPYDDAIARTQTALKHGTLKGILWHQGESDGSPELAAKYEGNLTALIARFRKDLDSPELPFIIGQLGQFPASPWSDAHKTVDQAQTAVAKNSKTIRFVSSDELTCNKDNIHFDAASLRTFGKRYAAAYLDLTKVKKGD